MKRNTAKAGPVRGSWDSATLTEGHAHEPRTLRAKRIVEAFLDGKARARLLGRGNFGVGYEVQRGSARVILKAPADKDMHGRVWKMSDLRHFFVQEAGVANELHNAGFLIAPSTVYVEVDSAPFIVREWGAVPANITPREFDALSEELALVVSYGWKVSDDLLIARRPNGSLFVADVGVWRRRPRGERMEARYAWDDLWLELSKLSAAQSWARGGGPDGTEGRPGSSKGYRNRDEHDVPSIAEIKYDLRELKALIARAKSKKGDDWERSWFGKDVERKSKNIEAAVAKRAEVGLPTKVQG